MKYYLIAGEASGDLHASNLMRELKSVDETADFRFFGGDLMAAQGGTLVKHYREMAFMGFAAVIANLRTVLNNLSQCKKDVAKYKPDAVILVDYPSFNLKIAQFVKENLPDTPVFYYISPKIWAWKEYRIKSIKKYVNHIFAILPFEVDYFKKHDYEVTYVGNPSVDAIENRAHKNEKTADFIAENHLSGKPIVAVLAGSRRHEIKKCLPVMLETAKDFPDYQFVVAGAPGISPDFYKSILGENSRFAVVFGQTYRVLQHSQAALINSGTASLEAALLNAPQAVGYSVFGGRAARLVLQHVIKVEWASLVNLIAGRLVVKEFLADRFTAENLKNELQRLLADESYRSEMLRAYRDVQAKLGGAGASGRAARGIFEKLTL
ncbi:MAG: lipid-A-disaccharide synthase [Prevotellaceae bacterium]|jgi:lipid-A-disaccharide synthase|nr:lipid-A-disaccharide synthase [Prevotellaceae bacterium]